MENYWQKVDEVLNLKQSKKEGISQAEAANRLRQHGPNHLKEGKSQTMAQRIIDQLKDPMIIVLIAAALVSGIFGEELADMFIIMVVVILNTVLGIYQENKAEKAIEALQNMSAPKATVRREGQVQEIAASELAMGDIVILEAGDTIPADLRLIESKSLKIEEAALTGESVPVEKDALAMLNQGHELPLGDRVTMAYMGTNIVYGRGEGVVTATGMATEMGKIADILANTGDDKTPLQQKLASLSKILSIVVLAISVFIFAFSIISEGSFNSAHILESFMTAVSLAVAAIPEGLVVVVTVMLSLGVTKMAKAKAIIRRLTAVETLGCTQIICSDKTGTLTQNKMTVVDFFGNEQNLALGLALCNDSQLGADQEYLGDPTETALMDYAQKLGLIAGLSAWPRLAEAPFDSDRKMMSTIHQHGEGKISQFTKGAPDQILNCCTHIEDQGQIRPLSDNDRANILAANSKMADKALRVLALGYKDYPALPQDISPANLEQGLVFGGLVGMIDPIRPEAKAAIEQCHSAGIKAIMITGDHKDTAAAIASELGILQNKEQAITGLELAALSDEQFKEKIQDLAVYARVQPEHKVRIVKMWKSLGRITAMTGDGVNDAPALKSADIGVGMGITGTDVTKNVADMVLADDNFATIVKAVREGRRIYENIRKAVQFLLASNLSEVVAIFIATLAGFTLFKPIQILWINLITDTFPAMALGMEKAEADIMSLEPRDPKQSIFADNVGKSIIWQGIAVAILTLIAFFIGNQQSADHGMTMAFLTLSLCEIFHSFNMRSRSKSIFSLKTHNKYLYLAMLMAFIMTIVVIYVPGINDLFHLIPISLNLFMIGIGLSIMVIPLVEIVKFIARR